MTVAKTIEVEGESIAAASAAAASQLGVGGDQISIEVLSEASRGVFGIGARKARVRATVRPAAAVAAADSAPAAEVDDDRPAAPARSYADGEGDEDRYQAEPLDDAAVARAAEVLEQIVGLTGITATVESRNDIDHATLELHGDTTGLLIGRKGQMLDALEYMISRIVGKDLGRTVHVTVDSQGYRARRQEMLEQLARRMGEEARRKGRPIRLDDLSPRERRIVHMVLRGERGITTRSSGEGHLRTLVILPNSERSRRDDGA